MDAELVEAVDGRPDTYLVDNLLFGSPGALSTYVVDADRPVLLDAGTADSAPRIVDALSAVGVAPADVAYVVVSHVHLDHAAGTSHLLETCENATAVVHERGLPYLTDPDRLDRLLASVEDAMGFPNPYGDPGVLDGDRCLAVSGGERLDLGDRELVVHDAPGHAPHHFVCEDPGSGTLFAADAVGAYDGDGDANVPSTPPPSFDLEANLETVARLRDLDPETLLFSHFGPAGDAPALLAGYADVLPAWVEAVADAREAEGDDVGAVAELLRPEWDSPTLERDVAGVFRYLDGK